MLFILLFIFFCIFQITYGGLISKAIYQAVIRAIGGKTQGRLSRYFSEGQGFMGDAARAE